MHALDKLRPVALLLVRCALGVIFVHHGYPKLFGNTAQFVQFFNQAGFPPYSSYLAGIIELFGGGLLVVGLFTRVAGLLLAVEMGIAIWKVHLGQGLLAVSQYEYPLALGVVAFALSTLGAGIISLDYAIFRQKA